MSDFKAHEALEQAQERSEHAHGNPTVAIAAAILAVMAALATMLTHSRATTGLVQKNEAILVQSKSTSQFNYYEAKRIKYYVYNALLEAGLGDAKTRPILTANAKREAREAAPILKKAQALQDEATGHEEHAEKALQAYEVLEVAVTLFEVSIVFVSISALTRNQALVFVAGGSSVVGVIFLVLGLLRHL